MTRNRTLKLWIRMQASQKSLLIRILSGLPIQLLILQTLTQQTLKQQTLTLQTLTIQTLTLQNLTQSLTQVLETKRLIIRRLMTLKQTR